MSSIERVRAVYYGSDGEATRALYLEIGQFGEPGAIAVNLFRAHKTSGRAKQYRGGNSQGSYRGQAYDRKQWSIDNLCTVLSLSSAQRGDTWGWKEDPDQPKHRWVLYVVLPTGQVSFHAEHRGNGPVFAGEWDGVVNAGAERIIRHVAALLDGTEGKLYLPPEANAKAPAPAGAPPPTLFDQ